MELRENYGAVFTDLSPADLTHVELLLFTRLSTTVLAELYHSAGWASKCPGRSAFHTPIVGSIVANTIPAILLAEDARALAVT